MLAIHKKRELLVATGQRAPEIHPDSLAVTPGSNGMARDPNSRHPPRGLLGFGATP